MYKLLFKTKIECVQCLTENFTHLDGINDNICACNTHNFTFNGLLMNKKYLERLLNLEGTIGWLYNDMFTFFTTLLKFSVEYNIEKKQLSDVLPSLLFVDTQDNVLKTNHCICINTFKLLRLDFTRQKKIKHISQRK